MSHDETVRRSVTLFYDTAAYCGPRYNEEPAMPDYDPTTVALVGEMLKVLDAEADAETMSYEDQLRAVQQGLTEALQTGDETEEPSPEDEQVMRQALGQLDAKAGDVELGYGEVLRRLLSAVDRQLFIWTSSVVQPPGPSGDYQVAVTEDSPIPEAMKPI